MVINELNKKSVKFKEKIPVMLKLAMIIPTLFVTLPFLLIVFINPSNLWFLPFALTWCALVFFMVLIRFSLISKVILTDQKIIVPNRGYHRHFSDVSGTVIIRNGQIMIPYKELLEVTVKEKIIYFTYKGLSNSVVLNLEDITKFITVLKEKLLALGINIPISIENNETNKNHYLMFNNNVLKNMPTLIIFIIFFIFPNFVGFYNIATGGLSDSLIFTVMTALVTITFFTVVFMYKDTITLSDDGIIKSTKIGDIDLGERKILYKDIVKVKETKWRVDIKTKSNGYIYFVPTDKERFYKEISNKLMK